MMRRSIAGIAIKVACIVWLPVFCLAVSCNKRMETDKLIPVEMIELVSEGLQADQSLKIEFRIKKRLPAIRTEIDRDAGRHIRILVYQPEAAGKKITADTRGVYSIVIDSVFKDSHEVSISINNDSLGRWGMGAGGVQIP